MWDIVYDKLLGKDIYIDTAFSLGNIEKDSKVIRLLDKEEFKRFVLKHGADKILFGTDSPWAKGIPYIKFIKELDISLEDKNKILGLNATKLLGLNP